MVATPIAATPSESRQPIRLTGIAAALVVLGIVLFASPPSTRIWIAAVILVGALLYRGGDAAAFINKARVKIYGGKQ